MAESKDQRRARLNREGKEYLASGQEHLLTDQHRTAMEYMARKNAKKTVKTTERRREAREGGVGGESVRATGTGVVKDEKAKAAISSFNFDSAKRDRTYGKIAGKVKELAEIQPSKEVLLPQPRSLGKGAVNTDTVHHDAMATIADHLSDQLEKAEDSGTLHSRDTRSIDDALTQGYTSLLRSNHSHNTGQVNDAKVHMEAAAKNLHSAATQMQSRGLPIHPDVLNAINQTHQAYVRSTVPGTGAMPHPGFRPPVERSQTVRAVPSGPKRLDASKISGDAVMSGEDESWAHGGSPDISAAQESNALMSRQIRDSLGY